MTEKTGKILTAIKINDHLKASSVLDVDSNENSRISARVTKKGFRILEVRLAIRFLISLWYFPESFFQVTLYSVIILY